MAGKTKIAYFPMGGGLDVSTPALNVPPGRALALVNYEPWYNGGYRRVAGYERFDGRPSPHAQEFTGFDVDDASSLSIGDPVADDSSGATGVVAGIWIDEGTYGTDTIGVTKVVGDFGNGNTCNTAAFTINSEPVISYAPSIELEDAWNIQTYTLYREDIEEIPGSGVARGAWRRGATSFAVRDNAGATAGILHKASTSGWVAAGIVMSSYIYFDAGGGGTSRALPEEGDSLSGFTSGATGAVHKVISHGGSTASNDEYGYIVITGITGGPFQDNEKLQESGTDFADADGADVDFAFSPGGIYQFHNSNFYGGADTYRTYGINRLDPAFEIDENLIVSPILLPKSPIDGQPANNKPFLIEVHRNYLFTAHPGGSLVQSVIGEPLTINGFLGSTEFGIGGEITGLKSVVGGVLIIATERETKGLFGKDETDWEMKLIGEKTGGQLYTTAVLDTVYSLDYLGITSTSRTDSFGSFVGATVSQLVQPTLNAYRDRATCASIVRGSNQYRLYFDDGTALVMYVPSTGMESTSRQVTKTRVEFGQLAYPDVVRQMYNTEDEEGKERSYFISDDGYVREDRVGTSFDGDSIVSYTRLVYNQLGSPSRRKKFRRAILEMQTNKALDMKFISDLSYGSNESKTNTHALEVEAAGGLWDLDSFDAFVWDGQTVATAQAQLGGTGTNLSLLVFNDSAIAEPFILQGAAIHYDLRRLQR